MNKEEILQEKLESIKNDDWNIPSEIDTYSLCVDMMDNIGSTIFYLRDFLIYSMFDNIISNKKISYEEMKKILKMCFDDKHVFYGLGRENDDSVFTRTFSLLVVDLILDLNNRQEEKFLGEDEILFTYKNVLDYSRKEKDLRGFVEVTGWAHSTAHTADVLLSLSKSEYLKVEELREILKLIKDKICVKSYTYVNEEDERLVSAFRYIYDRKLISTEEYVEWINTFKDVPEEEVPFEQRLRENRKIFLRSLYFRGKKLNFDEKMINAIEGVLDSLPAYF